MSRKRKRTNYECVKDFSGRFFCYLASLFVGFWFLAFITSMAMHAVGSGEINVYIDIADTIIEYSI